MKKLCLVLLVLLFLISCKEEPKKVSFPNEEISIKLNEEFTLTPEVINCSLKDILFEVEGDSISLKGLVLKGVKLGDSLIKVSIKDYSFELTLKVSVIENETLVSSIKIKEVLEIKVSEKVQLELTILPKTALDTSVTYKSSNNLIAFVSKDGVVEGVSEGSVTITVTSNDFSKVSSSITIIVGIIDTIRPVIEVDTNITSKDVTISYNQDFDPLEGVKATDNVDGDITSFIEVTGSVNNLVCGSYVLTYIVYDKALNKSKEYTRRINVVWDYSVEFIGHGGSYSGIMNTETAFLNAINIHGYTALECDLKQTQDGVFVLCHDDTFANITLNTTNYQDLKDIELTQTKGNITYTEKISTLKRYLEICQQYQVTPVIELKYSKGINNSDTSRMQALMDEIEMSGLIDKVILLSSQYLCLQWTRENGYDFIKCQYLVNSIESQTVLDRCIKWNFDVSFNIEYSNSSAWIKKYQENDLEVSSYTFSIYKTKEDVQSYIDKGVDYVTVDSIKPNEVTLPK